MEIFLHADWPGPLLSKFPDAHVNKLRSPFKIEACPIFINVFSRIDTSVSDRIPNIFWCISKGFFSKQVHCKKGILVSLCVWQHQKTKSTTMFKTQDKLT
jgi:hypothetical protein